MPTHGLGDVIATSLFAYGLMAVIALATAGFVSALVAGLAAVGRRAEAKAAAVASQAASMSAAVEQAPVAAVADGIDPAVVAAITAAVHTIAGAHRIVFIGETPASSGWTGEVRQLHHGSHHPHHER